MAAFRLIRIDWGTGASQVLQQHSGVAMMHSKGKMNPYDLIADNYDEIFSDHNPYYGPVNARERQVFEASVPEADGLQHALDIGCGTGFHTKWLTEKGYRTVGIDISTEMLRVAREKTRHWANPPVLLVCDAMDMSALGRRSFDVVTCLGSTLNHVQDWRLLSAQISERLRPSGRFIFSYDNFFGIDTLIWLFKRYHSGYHEGERYRNFLRNLRCLLRGQRFQNHWRMKVRNVEIEIPLTFETTNSFKRNLSEYGLTIESLTGVHLLSCFSSRVLEASAYLDSPEDVGRNWFSSRVLQRLENGLSQRLKRVCANVVGVAVKR